ncbi:hypothetical protein N0V90_003588 [Kalmusia sp. IMI 367209]|nr:hypothetical protein N0V90_003588 [Kalmusia sp. IMI 367209]
MTAMDTDPIESLFPPSYNRYMDIEWPLWNYDVLYNSIKKRDDGYILAFFAGNNYVYRSLTFELPAPLQPPQNRVDTATRNYLLFWTMSEFKVDPKEYMEMIEDDQDLLSSFLLGVLYMIDKLKKAVVPEVVQKERFLELLTSLEVNAHQQFTTYYEAEEEIDKFQQSAASTKNEIEKLKDILITLEDYMEKLNQIDPGEKEEKSDTRGESVAVGEHGNVEGKEQDHEKKDDGEEGVRGVQIEHEDEKKQDRDLDVGSAEDEGVGDEAVRPGSAKVPTKAKKRAKSMKAKQAMEQEQK